MSQKEKTSSEKVEGGVTMRDYLAACAARWQWFALSILVICSLGVLYIIRQQPKYQRMEQILVKEEDSGGTESVASSFSKMGLGVTNPNVYNELIAIQSPALMSQVVTRLGLDNNYTLKSFPHGVTLYGATLPFKVQFPDLDNTTTVSFKLKRKTDGTMEFSDFRRTIAGNDPEKINRKVTARGEYPTVKTPIGRIQVVPNPDYAGAKPDKDLTYVISHDAMQPTIHRYSTMLKAQLPDKDAEVINLMIEDVSTARAEDILRTLVEVYNQAWIDDRNKIAMATADFIDERLHVIENELGLVDSDISEYKSKIKVPDVEESAKVNLNAASMMSMNIIEASNELAMAHFIREYINDPANANKVLPINTGIKSETLEVEIARYNALLLQRNTMAEATTPNNPVVKDYDEELNGLRDAIKRGINTHTASLERAVQNLQGAEGNLRSNLSSGPKQAQYLLSVERKQKVMEELYLYLLQKREENQLSQKFTADNTRIITPPYGPLSPVAPKRKLILAIVFLISVALPAGLIYLMESSDNKVRSRHDLENMTAPFAGEIPFVGKKKRFAWLKDKLARKSKKKKKLETVPVTVQAGCRDMINESFRIVRSNIDFILKRVDGQKVLMMTSFNPGSGKSFITFNLAASFAIKGKKVLIIDCDLRHGSSSQFVGMPSKGISSYLTGNTKDWRGLVVEVKDTPGMYVMPIGHRPPNPAELLDNGEIGKLIEEAGAEYDYVFLDCPPIDVVADTQILEKYAEQTIFVVRAGLLEKAAIREIDDMYNNHRFRRMCILLNGTDKANSRYGTYGSSYYSSDF